MAIQTSCPNCDAAYTLADTQRGKKVRCRKCSESFVVGGAKDDAPVASSTKSSKALPKNAMQSTPRPAAKSGPPSAKMKPAPRRDRDRDDDEDEDDDRSDRRPSFKKKSGSGVPMVLLIVGGVLLLLLTCGGVGIFAVYYFVYSTVSNTVDNVAQNMQNNPFPVPNDPFPPPPNPNFPNFPNFPNPNDPLPDFATPKDVSEALDWLKNGTNDHKNKGADWLAKTAVDKARQKEVAAELEKLAADLSTKDAGMRALAVWAGPENGPTLLQELENNNGLWAGDKAGDYVGDALVRIQYAPAAAVFAKHLSDWAGGHGAAARRLAAMGPIAEKEVLKFMDSPNNDAHDEAAKLLRQFGAKPDVMFNQAVADLTSDDAGFKRGACDTIAKTPVDEARRAEVSKALETALAEHANAFGQPSAAAAAANALKTWGTKDNVQALVDELKRNDGSTVGPCMDALAKIKDERGAEAVAAHLTDFGFGRADVVRALREMGPVAAKAVAAYVNNPNADVQKDAQDLLKGYGAGAGVTFDAMAAQLSAADMNQRKRALEWLAGQPVDDAHQKQVARALDKMVDNDDFFAGETRKAASKAEVVWADKDSVPTLLKCMEKNDVGADCMEALGRLKDERAAVPLIAETVPGKPHIKEAAQALIAMGPVVETTLDNGLMNPAASARDKIAACGYLATDFGTKTSIPALTAACADPDAKVKAAAKAALAIVQKRNP